MVDRETGQVVSEEQEIVVINSGSGDREAGSGTTTSSASPHSQSQTTQTKTVSKVIRVPKTEKRVIKVERVREVMLEEKIRYL